MEYALIIGIDHYNGRKLDGAVKDAKDFKDWLLEANLVPESNIQLLISDNSNLLALDSDIDCSISLIINDAKKHQDNQEEKTRLYVFFSGHGLGSTELNTGLCLRYWPDLPNYYISSFRYLDAIMTKGLFDEILVFIDCCRERTGKEATKNPSFDLNPSGHKSPQTLVFYSTTFKELSFEIPDTRKQEDPNAKRGAFTSFLIEALKGGAAKDDGEITGESLKKYVKEYFKSYALKFERYQDAKVMSYNEGENIFICKPTLKKLNYNFVIEFKRNAHVTLFNPTADEFKSDTVTEGVTWQLTLSKGYFRIIDNDKSEEKYFAISNEDTINYEQF